MSTQIRANRSTIKRGALAVVAAVGLAMPMAATQAQAVDPQTFTTATQSESQDVHTQDVRQRILDIALAEEGVSEEPMGSNCQKYGDCVEWCGIFSTWVWQQAGIDIPTFPFTGDIYNWGKNNGKSRYVYAQPLGDVKPGDMILYGTGPETPQSSTHVDIVVEVHADHLKVVGGNVSEKVTVRDVPRANIYGVVSAT